MTNLQKVQKAIEIQGFIMVSVAGGPMKVTKVVEGSDGAWVTNLLTRDLDGYVKIRKTKAAVVAQANRIIANADQIAAARAERQNYNWAMDH